MSNKNKQLKKLKLHHDYLNRKVAEVTELRLHDRSIESKTILMRLKKEKFSLLIARKILYKILHT